MGLSPLANGGRPKKRERKKALMGKVVEFRIFWKDRYFWEFVGRKRRKGKRKGKRRRNYKKRRYFL